MKPLGAFTVLVWAYATLLLANGWVVPGRWWAAVPAIVAVVSVSVMVIARLLDPLLAVAACTSAIAAVALYVLYPAIAFVTAGGSVPGEDHGAWHVAGRSSNGVWSSELFVADYDGTCVYHARVHGALTLGLGCRAFRHVPGPAPAKDAQVPFVLLDGADAVRIDGVEVPVEVQVLTTPGLVVLAGWGVLVAASWLLRGRVRTLWGVGGGRRDVAEGLGSSAS